MRAYKGVLYIPGTSQSAHVPWPKASKGARSSLSRLVFVFSFNTVCEGIALDFVPEITFARNFVRLS